MKSEHIEQALRILSERRIAAQADYQARFQTIQTAIPEIGEINQQLSQASLSIMQIIQSGQQVQEKIAKPSGTANGTPPAHSVRLPG